MQVLLSREVPPLLALRRRPWPHPYCFHAAKRTPLNCTQILLHPSRITQHIFWIRFSYY